MNAPPMLAPRPLWFLRHGETDWNARRLSQGRTDNPLNAAGLAQAARAARLLAAGHERFGAIARIVSSPLQRARHTAEAAQAALSRDGVAPPLRLDLALLEVEFGDEEGRPMGDWYDRWIAGDFTPGGAEPFAALRARVVAAIDRITGEPGTALVVAHGGVFRALRAAMGLEPNVRLPNAEPIWLSPARPAWHLDTLDEAQTAPDARA